VAPLPEQRLVCQKYLAPTHAGRRPQSSPRRWRRGRER